MSVVYLYGFAPGDVRLPETGLLGVGDTVVELAPANGFSAVVSRVPETEYGDAALERNAASVEWMAEQGLRHEQVIAWFVDHATILPSRLLTLFSSPEALAATAERDGERIRQALERFGGLREWDLKVSYDPVRLEPHLGEISDEIRRLDREIEEATPGRAFLLRKKRQDLTRVEARAAASRLARELLTALEAHARDVARLTPPGDQAPVILNAALLVPAGQEEALLALARPEAERLEALGITARLTGPWAPYRFIESGRD
jgi:hypothetical protein